MHIMEKWTYYDEKWFGYLRVGFGKKNMAHLENVYLPAIKRFIFLTFTGLSQHAMASKPSRQPLTKTFQKKLLCL